MSNRTGKTLGQQHIVAQFVQEPPGAASLLEVAPNYLKILNTKYVPFSGRKDGKHNATQRAETLQTVRMWLAQDTPLERGGN
jgi:hypothetical protein